jgi:enolase
MSKISGLDAIEILDSLGSPTIQVEMRLESGAEAIRPSGSYLRPLKESSCEGRG